ncbi:M28 family metallopeptidase [Clostridium rectalis]|uniref:M28 family metallopeptidase n=1 Tax=Clostridium rectalis TaxID=2040295 RepID=UPI0013DE75A3|nr:M28 family metallopeptidase [Clostridium rectalis]
MIKNIEYLSSQELRGRLPGTIENIQAAQYVKDKFIENKLSPFNNNYYQSFQYYYPERIEGDPYLKVFNVDGELIRNYTYGKDFKEDLINFRNNKIRFNRTANLVFKNDFFTISQGKDEVLFFTPEKDNLSFRSSFMYNAKMDMYVMVTKSTRDELKKFIDSDFTIECFIPYKISKTNLYNITAMINGVNSDKSPIVVSSHFDHVGTDLSNITYPGALDNASGTAFVIEMSKYINSLGKPKRNILFLSFNAEEFGLIGSTEFAKKYYSLLKNSKIFNFDMVGTNNSAPLCIMGGKKDSVCSPIIKSVSDTCSKEKIYFNYLFDDSSDHYSFRKLGIDAITFIDNDVTRIHTPNDKATFISSKSIDRCFKVASKEIIKNAFDNDPFILYNNELTLASLMFIIILFILECKDME